MADEAILPDCVNAMMLRRIIIFKEKADLNAFHIINMVEPATDYGKQICVSLQQDVCRFMSDVLVNKRIGLWGSISMPTGQRTWLSNFLTVGYWPGGAGPYLPFVTSSKTAIDIPGRVDC